MDESITPEAFNCHTCGRQYEGQVPKFCLTCGTSLYAPAPSADTGSGGQPQLPTGPVPSQHPGAATPQAPQAPQSAAAQVPKRKGRAPWIAIAAILVVLLIAGGTLAAVLILRGGEAARPLPTTVEQMKASVLDAQEYLSSHWKTLAPMRSKGAPVYSVDAKLDTTAHSISGKALILYTNNAGTALQEVVLRVYANSKVVNAAGSGAQISSAKVDGKPVAAVLKGSLLRVPLPDGLAGGSEALIELDFKESIPEISGGLGGLEQLLGQSTGGGYGVFGHSKNVYDLGYFIPSVASYTPQGWESREVPALGDVSFFDCAYYTVSIDVPENYLVVAPGISSSGGGGSGRKSYQFRGGPLRDFTAQASPDYVVSKVKEGEATISSCYLKGAKNGEKALGFARQAVREYNKHIGPYPYVGLNVCEAPLSGGAGGMEFSGQVQIAELVYGDIGKLLGSEGSQLDSLMSSLGGGLLGDMLEFTIAHEVCHQWFGLAVGSDSLAHPWLDESLTNYCSVLYFRWAHGEEAAKKQLDMQVVMPYSAGMLLGGGDMVVDTPASGFDNATQYSAVVYSKGALFYQALEKQMGAEAFEKGLKKYYEDFAFRVATPQDLVASFSSEGNGEAVASLHRRWILETHADEDIAATMPGMDMLNDLLKDLPGGLDLNNLEDLLKQFMPNGSMPELPYDMQLDNGEPVLPI